MKEKKLKEVRCPICHELVGYNETGKIAQASMFCKNRPHKLTEHLWKKNEIVKDCCKLSFGRLLKFHITKKCCSTKN